MSAYGVIFRIVNGLTSGGKALMLSVYLPWKRRHCKIISVDSREEKHIKNPSLVPHNLLHRRARVSYFSWTETHKRRTIQTLRHRVPCHMTWGSRRDHRGPNEILVVFWKLDFVKPQWSCQWPPLALFSLTHSSFHRVILIATCTGTFARPQLFAPPAPKLHEPI